MQISKADLAEIEKAATTVRRKARTISLDDVQYETLQRLCNERGWQLNKVVDALIKKFLEAAK